MSLINEALKQAKANTTPEAAPPSAEEASSPAPPDAMSSAVFVAQPTERRGRKGTDIMIGMLIFLLLSLLLAAAGGGIYFIHSMRAADRTPPSTPNDTTPPQTAQSSTKGPAAPTPPAGNTAGSQSSGSPRKPNLLAQSLNRAKAVANTVHKREMTPTAVVAQQQAASPAAPEKTVPLAPDNITRAFKLTGIVEGPTGRLALINGTIVKQGRAVGNGRVLTIAKDYVLLEVNRKTYRLEIPGDSGF